MHGSPFGSSCLDDRWAPKRRKRLATEPLTFCQAAKGGFTSQALSRIEAAILLKSCFLTGQPMSIVPSLSRTCQSRLRQAARSGNGRQKTPHEGKPPPAAKGASSGAGAHSTAADPGT